MFLLLGAIGLCLFLLYLRHVEKGLATVPEEVTKLASPAWTKEAILAAYNKVSKRRIDFQSQVPPKLNRRYVIVGGSGLVGGHIILHLLARGQSPASIRNIDFRKPIREDLLSGSAVEVDYTQADITKEESIRAAFSKSWPKSVAHLPLTVFHTAAVIVPGTRKKMFYSALSTVNVLGVANVIAAAKSAGAGVFVATSSGSIAIRPLDVWFPPWQKTPKRLVQFYADPEKDVNIRPHDQYFGNYAVSKARAEEIVIKANNDKFRTGCIRPACGIYGSKYDLTVGQYLNMGVVLS